MINCLINKLMNLKEPNEAELIEVFDEIFSGLADEISATSFITLVEEKKELFKSDSMCLSCAIKSARERTNRLKLTEKDILTFEAIQKNNSSDYFDISFAIDIIMSANEVSTSKYTFSAPFKLNRSFETLKSLDIKPKMLGDDFYDDFEKTNFLYLEMSNNESFYKYISNISRKLPFQNILNITEKFLNPCNVKNQFIALNSKDEIEKYANICLNIKNENTLIVSGGNEMPFATIEGETHVAEAWKNKIFTYILTPELLGIERGKIEELKCENVEHNKEAILNLFKNKERNSFYNAVILNCALALYIVKKANSVMDGVKLAKKTIEDNLAYEKILQLQKTYC